MLSLSLGLLTTHIISPNLDYCKNMGGGIINNKYLIARYETEDTRYGVLAGEDSVCEPIYGGLFEYKIEGNLWLTLGAYNVNKAAYRRRGIAPNYMFDVTPIAGINYRIPITDHIAIDNLITPFITTHAITVRF